MIKSFMTSSDFQQDADGSKDTIDCGSGNDEAWINVSTRWRHRC